MQCWEELSVLPDQNKLANKGAHEKLVQVGEQKRF